MKLAVTSGHIVDQSRFVRHELSQFVEEVWFPYAIFQR